eukprot:scaffold6694_cov101-Isochrysis_galbana.AAC.4
MRAVPKDVWWVWRPWRLARRVRVPSRIGFLIRCLSWPSVQARLATCKFCCDWALHELGTLDAMSGVIRHDVQMWRDYDLDFGRRWTTDAFSFIWAYREARRRAGLLAVVPCRPQVD